MPGEKRDETIRLTDADLGHLIQVNAHYSTENGGRDNENWSDAVGPVTGLSDDATLSALGLSAGTLSPTFDAATTSYTASVGNAVSSVTVTKTANDANASVSQSPTNPVALAVGDQNVITVTVTAEDGTTTKEYTVRVTRDAPGVSSDATLSALSLSEGALSPAFDPNATTSYTASVGNDHFIG